MSFLVLEDGADVTVDDDWCRFSGWTREEVSEWGTWQRCLLTSDNEALVSAYVNNVPFTQHDARLVKKDRSFFCANVSHNGDGRFYIHPLGFADGTEYAGVSRERRGPKQKRGQVGAAASLPLCGVGFRSVQRTPL